MFTRNIKMIIYGWIYEKDDVIIFHHIIIFIFSFCCSVLSKVSVFVQLLYCCWTSLSIYWFMNIKQAEELKECRNKKSKSSGTKSHNGWQERYLLKRQLWIRDFSHTLIKSVDLLFQEYHNKRKRWIARVMRTTLSKFETSSLTFFFLFQLCFSVVT